VDDAYVASHEAGSVLDLSSMDGVQSVEVKWTSKWKWYQWAMKRFHLQWGPETHGSKFHRHIWSMWNRKPRRTMKNHPHAGHMWDETITLKHVEIIDCMKRDNEEILLVKGSLPGARNGKLKFIIE
jgi:large subunit ribosomal protein L3